MGFSTVLRFAHAAEPEQLFTGQWQSRPTKLDEYKPSGLRRGDAGAASSMLNAVQTLGGSLGLAMLVAVASRSGMSLGFTAGAVCAGVALLAALLIRPGSGANAGPGA
ncbi:hypothetical protein [Streptomyces sp. NBC_01296]|uniref:hypothetical protein n=1 Tax=Streptomyces sp. NBC_01296 TaxID=2903816 RepID=UPI002E137371|nr:hypothetical protein OG299_41200 [Streptomyces sp. NBC_01296]